MPVITVYCNFGLFFNFDIVNPLSKSNAGRGRRPNFVFQVVESVLFFSGWVGGDGMDQSLV